MKYVKLLCISILTLFFFQSYSQSNGKVYMLNDDGQYHYLGSFNDGRIYNANNEDVGSYSDGRISRNNPSGVGYAINLPVKYWAGKVMTNDGKLLFTVNNNCIISKSVCVGRYEGEYGGAAAAAFTLLVYLL